MGRGPLLAASCALAIIAGSFAPAFGVAAQSDDDGVDDNTEPDVTELLLDDIGPGFELVGDALDASGQLDRSFSGDAGSVLLTGFAVTDPPGTRVLFPVIAASTPELGVTSVPEPSLDLAVWLVPVGQDPDDRSGSLLAVAARDLIFLVGYAPSESVTGDPTEFLLDLAARQIDAAGGPPPPEEDGGRDVDDRELLPWLPEAAPEGYGFTGLPIDLAGADELPTQGLESEVADFLNNRARNVVRVWVQPELSVAAAITQYPYDIFAASGLATWSGDRLVEPPPDGLAAIPDAIAFRQEHNDDVGVAFRRGDVLALVITSRSDGVPEEVALDLAVDTAMLMWDRLPSGGTSAYEFPPPFSKVAGLLLTAGFVTAAVAGATGVAKLRARRVRRRWSQEEGPATWAPPGEPPPGAVTELDDDARALRRRGAVVATVQVVTVNVGVVALAGDFGLTGWIVAAAAMLTGLAFSRWWLRREYALLGPKAPPRAFVTPRPLGVVCGLAAFAVLGIGVAYLLKGVRYVILKPTLAQLEWSDRLGLAPRAVGVVFAIGGLVTAAVGAVLYRLARSYGRARVRRVLEADPRPPALYLRSFDDDALPLPIIASARRPLFELFSIRGADPFEEAVAWELDSYGPVVAVGRPDGSLRSLGAAREHLPHDSWREQVAARMTDAGVVALAPGETEGLAWELGAIVHGGHLHKTLFVFPPLAPSDLARRWSTTTGILRDAGARVGELPAAPSRIHSVRVDVDGSVRVTTASRRDEATYRTAVDRALEVTAPPPAAVPV